jgi:glycosyltransferase 2 family protein
VHEVVHAARVFFDGLAAVEWKWLAIALGLHVLKLVVRSHAWRNILAAAYPNTAVRDRYVLGAYTAGVGVNAVLPARLGDVLKLFLIKRRIEGAHYAVLASSLFAETLVDLVLASTLLVWAVVAGVLPGLNVLPHLPEIDWSWAIRHPRWTLVIAGVVVVLLVLSGIWANRKIDELRRKLAQGIAILHDPPRYFSQVVSWQVLSWGLRLGTVYFCLRAFHVEATVHDALLVQVADSLSTVLPFSPGGVGTKQGLIVYMLQGKASATQLLSFSVGMHIAVTTVNVVLAVVAIALMQRTLHFRRTFREATTDRAADATTEA